MSWPAIEDLLPHRGPMLLLDRVVSFEPPGVVCETTIREDDVFCRDGAIDAMVGLEYMAQACAACAGLTLRAEGKKERVGYLVGVPKMSLEVARFPVGQTLQIHAAPIYKGIDAGAFETRIELDGDVVATARLIVLGREVDL